jgi:RNA polymerase sigma factor (sigma-70 family)
VCLYPERPRSDQARRVACKTNGSLGCGHSFRRRALNDTELWSRTRAGDAEAFASLYERYANAVYSYCFRRTADWAAADELTSVVFLEAWRKRKSVELGEGGLLPWLLGVATNAARNRRRSLRRFRSALERLPALEPERDFSDDLVERLQAQEQMRALLDEIRHLPNGEQDVLVLCVWQGLSSAEAGAALGIPEGSVRTRLMRLRGRLRQAADRKSEFDPCSTARKVAP